MSFNTVSLIGLGYIGLPTAAMFASSKKHVIGVDINQDAVDTINAGKIHIFEPGLEDIVTSAVSEGFLKGVTTPEPADAFLIAVPTPFLPVVSQDDIPQPDLRYIEAAARSVAKVLKKGDLVILESTSPVGTTEKMAEWLEEERADLTFPQTHGDASDIRVAHCPERVLPGQVIRELIDNDRVIGGMTPNCSRAAMELYKIFVEGEFLMTNARTAEMVKLTENASRDVNIAFANELSVICDELDIDVWELIRLANRHPRVNILQPGPGVGGHCIAVDPWFIVSKSPSSARLMHAARKINDEKPQWVIEKVKVAIADALQANVEKTARDITIACYGLAFKPDIDDLRESPAMKISESILNMHSGKLLFVEPHISALPASLGKARLVNMEQAVVDADIHLLLVDHTKFKSSKPRSGMIIDTKGIWD